MDKLCETINRQCCLHCEMECDGKWLETEIEMYKEDLLKKQSDKISDLEAKLAESEKSVISILENTQLKQQLEEKEKEIEELKKGVYKVTLGTTPSNQIDFTENFYVIQNQTSIAELEKVKKLLVEKMKLASDKLDCAYYIDQQIKELKGETDGKDSKV